MKRAHCTRIGLVLVTGIFTLITPARSQQAADSDGKAHALLDQVRKEEMDRQIATHQTEIDRLKQDEDKAKADASTLQKTIDSTSDLVAESSEDLNKLASENKKLEHDLAVNQARINAERQKIEGLRALGAAQTKSLNALNRHLEEVDAKTKVRSEEMSMLTAGQNVPAEGREEKAQSDLYRWRKALATAEAKEQSEDRLAHDAMKSAASKLAVAEAGAARAERLAMIDPLAEAPAPIAEKSVARRAPKAAEAPAAVTDAAPVRRATPVKPEATPAPKQAAAVKATPKPASAFGAPR